MTHLMGTPMRLTKQQRDTLKTIKAEGKCKVENFSKRVIDNLVKKKLIEYDVLYQLVSPVSTELLVAYDRYYSGGDVCPGQQDQSYPDHEDEFCSTAFVGVFEPSEKGMIDGYMHDRFDVTWKVTTGMPVFAVIVNYDTGSTFGKSLNHSCIVDIFKDKAEADAAVDAIEDGTFNGYKAWDGYFEHYNHTEVHSFQVNQRI